MRMKAAKKIKNSWLISHYVKTKTKKISTNANFNIDEWLKNSLIELFQLIVRIQV